MMYRGPYSSDFYRQLHVTLHREFRSHKIWRELRATGPQPERLRRQAHDVATMLYNRAMLPVERRKLDKLAVPNNSSLGMLPQIMSPEAASKPSPQGD
jgi:hypothetical protein